MYVLLYWFTASAEHKSKFVIEDADFTTQAQPYDYHSIMHFTGEEYSVNGKRTLISTNPDFEVPLHGQSNTPTDTDYTHLYIMYCGGK